MTNESTSSANIETRSDGLYLVINNASGAEKVTRKQVLDLIESFGVKGVSLDIIQEIFQSSESYIERKISENKSVAVKSEEIKAESSEPYIERKIPEIKSTTAKNEEIKVEIARDRRSASITFSPASAGGRSATEADIMEALLNANVKWGINTDEVRRLASNHVHGISYPIAHAKAPRDGKNGYLEFGFDPNEKKEGRPKLLENGNVDFRSLNLIEMVEKGQRLITFIPPEEGEDGTDVLGNPIPYKRGLPAPKVIRGQGVALNEEETEMTALTSGQVTFLNKKLSVNPLLEIPSDVGPSTGNIQFNGSVTVRGNVVSGYSVIADGDVDIHGTVEASKIEAGVNVFMYSGVQGGEKAIITAGGDINTKFAEGCTLKAGRNIVANSIMHSNVFCVGSLVLDGKNGNLIGGSTNVGGFIKAKVIGSSMATSTEIIVGNNPERLEEYNALAAEYGQKVTEFEKMDNLLQKLIEEHNAGKTSADKKNLLLKSLQVKAQLKKGLVELETKLSDMKRALETQRGEIYAYGVIRSGVKVTIGNATMFIRDDMQNALLRNEDSKIVIRSAV